jgi:hypothetical protein
MEAHTSGGAAMTKTKRAVTPPNGQGRLSVYDGQVWCGCIAETSGFVAYDADGVMIGKFQTLREASRAIPPATK